MYRYNFLSKTQLSEWISASLFPSNISLPQLYVFGAAHWNTFYAAKHNAQQHPTDKKSHRTVVILIEPKNGQTSPKLENRPLKMSKQSVRDVILGFVEFAPWRMDGRRGNCGAAIYHIFRVFFHSFWTEHNCKAHTIDECRDRCLDLRQNC